MTTERERQSVQASSSVVAKNQPLRRQCESSDYQSCLFTKVDLSYFFQASFYPGRGQGNIWVGNTPASTLSLGNSQFNVTDGESEVESVADWLDEPEPDLELEEPAPQRQSKFSDGMVIEVRAQYLKNCSYLMPLL